MVDKFYEFTSVTNIKYDSVHEIQGKIINANLYIDDNIRGMVDLTFTHPSVSLPVNPKITIQEIFNNLKADDIDSIKVIGSRTSPDANIQWRLEFWMNSNGPYVIRSKEIKGLPEQMK